jgi:hypothetical protein
MSENPGPQTSEEFITKLRALRQDPSPIAHLKPTFERRPFHGSCHCKLVQYVVWLDVPTAATPKDVDAAEHVVASGNEIYKCNCTTCHKMGLFHWRFNDSPAQFALLTPVDDKGMVMEDQAGGVAGLRNYQCFQKRNNWWFCGTCGVRCFTSEGQFEVAEIPLPAGVLQGMEGLHVVGDEGETKVVRVWRPKKEGWDVPPRSCYLSVNATSLDAHQDGADLRELHEKGWLLYLDFLSEVKQAGIKPYAGGLY